MPAFEIRERLLPYRLLAYLLYGSDREFDWLEQLDSGKVRIITGDCARSLRMKNVKLWESLRWLRDNKLIDKLEKEDKRGSVLVYLRTPTNLGDTNA